MTSSEEDKKFHNILLQNYHLNKYSYHHHRLIQMLYFCCWNVSWDYVPTIQDIRPSDDKQKEYFRQIVLNQCVLWLTWLRFCVNWSHNRGPPARMQPIETSCTTGTASLERCLEDATIGSNRMRGRVTLLTLIHRHWTCSEIIYKIIKNKTCAKQIL